SHHTAPEPAATEGPDPLDQAIEDLQRRPLRGAGTAVRDEDEPSFVRQGRRRQRMGRLATVTMSAGSVLLLVALIAQSAYVFRDQLAARFPQTAPWLHEACAYLGCQVGLPAQIEAVAIESSELQTLAPNTSTLGLTVLLRNHGTVAQSWPYLELTLNDNAGKVLARRVFAPSEYLPGGSNPRTGFAARSEQPVRLFFEPEGIQPSGYRVYVFYP
ncbi:MAG TPA: DUF3426 domain-containing protein, partial [Noviherbaspirillum sp.]|nr:DUF3426 domain-containing protein [Noviherbaspirillum sp.]